MAHLTAASSPAKLCIYFPRGGTIDIEMKYIGHRSIPYRGLSNPHFPPFFSCASDFLDLSETSACKSTTSIPSLEQCVLM